jgi:hypothetical protein
MAVRFEHPVRRQLEPRVVADAIRRHEILL